MILSCIRKSRLYAQSIKIARVLLPWQLDKSHRQHLHFRGWFSTSVLGRKIELFNFNTELETTLFWTNSISEVETSLVCFTALAENATWIIDVGANTGIFVVAASNINRSATTFAIEPNYTNFKGLSANVRRNELPVCCLNLAATSENKLVTLWDFPQEISYSASLEREFREGQGTIPVNVFGIKLDEILLYIQPSDLILMKIDVESHEAEVVRGLSNVLADEERQIIFLMEVIRDGVGRDLDDLLNSNRFAYFRINDESRELLQTVKLKPFDGFNYLIVSRNILTKVVECLRNVSISARLLDSGTLELP